MQHFTKSFRLLLLLCLLDCVSAMAQNTDSLSKESAVSREDSLTRANAAKVSGVIKDAATGKPVAGIYVSVTDFSSAITNEHGEFSIAVPNGNALLLVRGQSYQHKEVPVKGRTSLPEIILFEETFTSIYDQARMPFSNLSANQQAGAVTTVNTLGAWEAVSQALPDSYLQGKIPGLSVIRRSGAPNSGANLFLRGYSSLYANNAPLVVLDGMIYDTNQYGTSTLSGYSHNPFSYLDLRDVDNFTVLKDASAGIYGTKGANGVILISTNNHPDVATKIDFGVYSGFNYFPKSSLLPMMQGADFRTYLSDVLRSSGQTPEQIAAQPYMNDARDPKINPGYWAYHNNTDWQRQAFNNGYNSNYNLRVSGGDNIARYVLSMNYGNNKGIVENTGMTRYNTRFNSNLNISEKFLINANLSFTYNEQRMRDQGVSPKTNPIFLSLVKSPLFRVYDVNEVNVESPNKADVDALGFGNPAAIHENAVQNNLNYRFFGSINFKYTFNKYFSAQTLFGVTSDKVRENVFIPRKGIANDTIFNAGLGTVVDSRLGSQTQRLFDVFSDTYLSYNRTFNRIHSLGMYLGTRYKYSDARYTNNRGFNSPIDEIILVNSGLADIGTGGDIGKSKWLNNYFNANYQLSNKYILGFNLAVDGSSRFGTSAPDALTIGGAKFAVLPAVSAAWVVSSERFMNGVNSLELLKLRASYGLTGNDDIGNYAARQYYVSQHLLGLQGLVRANVGNPELQWEVNKKFNLGLDASFLQERLNITADYFNNTTDNMLVQENAPSITGLSYLLTNNGGMETNGVELGVNGRIISKASLKWDLGFNIYSYKNKITKLPGGRMESQFAGATVLTQVGLPANVFYGFKTNGVYSSNSEAFAAGVKGAGISVRNSDGSLVAQQGGDMRFVDVNGDDIIDNKDKQVIGDPNPDFAGGVSSGLTYKRFNLQALVTFTKGNDIYNYTRRELESQGNAQNQTLAINNRWRSNGQVTDIPRASFGDPSGNAAFSDRWIEDGSHVRLRTVSVSYDIPLNYKFLKYTKVYLTGNNLLTFTRYMGYDPEVTGGQNVLLQGFDTTMEPQFRTVQLGLRIGI